ncbi:Alpha/Beta hydrolase protein [Chytriomyces sp. MP71]|nr:Alpha/Beta hydrolase protein [Chytriomyces sp. MP71]
MKFQLDTYLLLSACTVAVNAVPVPEGITPSSLWAERGNNYPTVFLHGILGWGEDAPLLGFLNYFGGATQNLLDVARSQGFTVVSPHMGPLSSNWERACEAFAQLTGLKTDYGVARSTQFGHARFGEDWTGNATLPSFAANFQLGSTTVIKINLVGHSMGGPTARMLTHLLTFGSQAEMDACASAKTACSPLFWTNKTETYVHSLLTLSGVHQGSPVADYLHATNGLYPFAKTVFSALVGINNVNNANLIWDMQLGHWGLKQNPGESFLTFLERVCNSHWYSFKSNALYDLQVGAQSDPLLSFVQNNPKTTYFSVAGLSTNYLFGIALAEISTNLLLAPFANLIGTYSNSSLPVLQTYTQEYWRNNDGMVPIASSRGPNSGFNSFNVDMDASSVSDLANSAPAGVPQQGTYNYLGAVDNVDHLAIVGTLDLIPGLRDALYINIMRIVGSVAP